jgi:hypothetical protein
MKISVAACRKNANGPSGKASPRLFDFSKERHHLVDNAQHLGAAEWCNIFWSVCAAGHGDHDGHFHVLA